MIPMVLTEKQMDWILGTLFVVLLAVSVALAFWPQRRRRHGRQP